MNIGEALQQMRNSKSVRRAGWNGKGMHIYLEEHMSWPEPRISKGKIVLGTTREYAPCIVLYTAQGVHQPGWNASTPDLLADDWEVADHA